MCASTCVRISLLYRKQSTKYVIWSRVGVNVKDRMNQALRFLRAERAFRERAVGLPEAGASR